MPVRIERWKVAGKSLYKVVGILWGGEKPTNALAIRFNPGDPWTPVDVCPAQTHNDPWTLWSHAWSPTAPGRYAIQLAVLDKSVRTRRLDSGFYSRTVDITRV